MGIFRDLVGNVAQAEAQKKQQQTAQNLAWGDILTTLIQNPATDDATYQKAASLYHDLLGKQGGKTGKDLQGQIAQFLGAYGVQRRNARAQQEIMDKGGTQPQQGEPTSTGTPGTGPGGLPAEQPVPAGQRADQPGGVNYGWSTAGPATAAGTTGAQDGRQGGGVPERPGAGGTPRHGFGKVLGGLAGVGKEMMGIPSSQAGMIPSATQIQRMYGPTGMETAQEKEREAISVGRMDEQEYEQQQQKLVGRGLQTQAEADENVREFVRQGGKAPSGRAEEAQTLSTVELRSTGEVIPVWISKRNQKMETLDHKPIDMSDVRATGTPVDPKATGRLKERIDLERILRTSKNPDELAAAKAEKSYMDIQAESAVSMAQIRARQLRAASAIVPGTDEFNIARDLAYGKLTYDGFKGLVSYRDTNLRMAIYTKATQLNPDFTQSLFEAGYRFFARPQTRQQLGAIDNVQAATDDMIQLSEAAKRGGSPLMNKFELPAGYMLGSKPYSNFQTALTAYADELSGALGFGSTTDMTRQLGIKMSDGNVDPDTFLSNLQIVQGFLERKRNGLLGQMSVYGKPGGMIPEIHDMDEYNALPPGSKWRKPSDPPTTERTKPGQ